MARIVIGIGTSHSPQVSTGPESWHLHAERDYANPVLDMDALQRTAPAGIATQLAPSVYQAKHDACQAAIARLSQALHEAAPDVVVIVGDDQRELFRDECLPAFAVYTGSELYDVPPAPETVVPSHRPALWSRHQGVRESYPLMPAFASHIVGSLVHDGFDVATASKQYEGRSLGHAYTFVRLRLMGETIIPIVPVFINTYFPPNQPTPARCFAFGAALRKSLESWDANVRIALVASGGLSHFVIDEQLDDDVLYGIRHKRSDVLVSLPEEKLNSGSSEIRNWIVVAGALEDFSIGESAYTPAYRTPSGTGCGMAFVRWDPLSLPVA